MKKLLQAAMALMCLSVGTIAPAQQMDLTEDELRNLVERSYQYVAMYNVNNKFADTRGGWNVAVADTELKDHTFTDIARPNNDTLYITAMLDLRTEPMVVQFPAFDSTYVSIMITGYDHYVDAPMSTRLGDFAEPETVLFYTERTQGYSREPVEGVDRVMEMTGDFVSALMRVMPHSNEPERFERIIGQMRSVEAVGLSEFLGQTPPEDRGVDFPAVGETDADVFGTNLLEVMQFAFNHTTFDPDDPLDVAVLEAWEPFGIVPGGSVANAAAMDYERDRFRAMSLLVAEKNLRGMDDPDFVAQILPRWGAAKGDHTLTSILAQSAIGPIPLPIVEATYPVINTSDGTPLNSANDYVIRMSADELPPANAFWSVTLYDLDRGFFIPNEQFKYSVGANAGYKLDESGGIEIHIAAEQPEGVPAENWLPINRDGNDLSANLRIYAPDLERMETWTPPLAEPLN